MTALTPLVVFAFNRPDSLGECLVNVAAVDPRHSQRRRYLFVDGAKDAGDERWQRTRELAEGAAQHGWLVTIGDENAGLRRSLMAGVSKVLAEHPAAIVLEDDLSASSATFDFFDDALARYRDDERVWAVCGYMYDVPALGAKPRAMRLPYAHPWGWATWADRWSTVDFERRVPAGQLRSRAFRQAFDAHGVRDFSSVLSLTQMGLLDSWFISWYLAMFEGGRHAVFPSRSVIANAGIGRGTHGSRLNPYQYLVKPRAATGERVTFDDDGTIDWIALDRIAASYDARVQRGISSLGAVRRRWRAR